MAEIAHTALATQNGDTLYTWASVTETDTFEPLELTSKRFRSLCIQVGGTFGGATVVVNGSNDDTTYAGLDDQAGTAISVTAAAVKNIGDFPLYVKPVASGGTGQSLTVKLLVRS